MKFCLPYGAKMQIYLLCTPLCASISKNYCPLILGCTCILHLSGFLRGVG